MILLGIHTAGDHDGDVLLGHGGVGKNAGHFGQANESRRALGNLLEGVDDDLELVGLLHDTAEHHGDDRHGNGRHHTHDTAAFQESCHGVARFGRKIGFEHGERFLREVVAVLTVIEDGTERAGAGLEDQAEDDAGNNTEGDAGDRGNLHGNCHDNDDRRQEQHRADVKDTALGSIQRVGELDHAGHIRLAAVILHHAEDAEEDQGDGVGDAGGQDHGLDVGDNVRTGHGGSEVRRIGQRAHLIAEIGAGENRAGGHAGAHAETVADAHQRNAHRTHRTPGGTGGERGDGADQNAGNEENCGFEDLQAVVDHRRHDARVDPHADQDTDDDQDADRLQRFVDTVHHGLFNFIPLIAEMQCHDRGSHYADKHRYMRVNSELDDTDRERGDQNQQCQQGFPQLGHSLFLTHSVTNLSKFLGALFVWITMHIL